MTDRTARFWEKVVVTPGCWLWTGYVGPTGYGQVKWDGKMRAVHHIALLIVGSSRPEGLETDHLCFVRRCVNPAHLEWVTHRENIRRSEDRLFGGKQGSYQRSKTHCVNGHPFDASNTRLVVEKAGNVRRRCVTCQNEATKQSMRRRRAVKA